MNKNTASDAEVSRLTDTEDDYMVADASPKDLVGRSFAILTVFSVIITSAVWFILNAADSIVNTPADVAMVVLWPAVLVAYTMLPVVFVCLVASSVLGVRYIARPSTLASRRVWAGAALLIIAVLFVLVLGLLLR